MALAIPGSARFAEALRRCWDERDAVLALDPRLSDWAVGPHRRDDAARLSSSTHRARRPPSTVECRSRTTTPSSWRRVGRPGSRKASCSPTPPSRPRRGPTSAPSRSRPLRGTAGWPACPLPHVGRPLRRDEGDCDGDACRDPGPFLRRGVRGGRPGTRRDAREPRARRPRNRLGPEGAALFPRHRSRRPTSRPPTGRPTRSSTYGMTETGSGVVYDGLPLEGVELRPSTARSGSAARCCCAATGTGPTRRRPAGWFRTGDAGEPGRRRATGDPRTAGRRRHLGGREHLAGPGRSGAARSHAGVTDVAVAGRARPGLGFDGSSPMSSRRRAGLAPRTGEVARRAPRAGERTSWRPSPPLASSSSSTSLPRSAIGKVSRAELPALDGPRALVV